MEINNSCYEDCTFSLSLFRSLALSVCRSSANTARTEKKEEKSRERDECAYGWCGGRTDGREARKCGGEGGRWYRAGPQSAQPASGYVPGRPPTTGLSRYTASQFLVCHTKSNSLPCTPRASASMTFAFDFLSSSASSSSCSLLPRITSLSSRCSSAVRLSEVAEDRQRRKSSTRFSVPVEDAAAADLERVSCRRRRRLVFAEMRLLPAEISSAPSSDLAVSSS